MSKQYEVVSKEEVEQVQLHTNKIPDGWIEATLPNDIKPGRKRGYLRPVSLPGQDEPKGVVDIIGIDANDFKEFAKWLADRKRPFGIDVVRKWLKWFEAEEISFSKFVELLNYEIYKRELPASLPAAGGPTMIPVVAVKDSDGHWYVVPKEFSHEFHKMEEEGEADEWEKFNAKFSHYRTGGDLNNIQLYRNITDGK